MADEGIPDAVVAAWDQATAAWEDRSKHDALLALVATHSCYAWAASRYKTRAGDPVADEQIERLRKAATANLLATAAARPEQVSMPYRNTLLVLVVLLFMIVLGVIYATVKSRSHEPPEATTGAPP